jgi:hypothetical protein
MKETYASTTNNNEYVTLSLKRNDKIHQSLDDGLYKDYSSCYFY